MVDYSKKKVAVVLSGGSARGLAHIGVLRGLEEMGIRPSIIVGTSMGSIVGALYCWNPRWRWVAAEAKRYKIRDMLSFKEFLSIKRGLIRGNRFEAEIKRLISDAEFSELHIPLVINAVDVATGKTHTFTKGKVSEAVRASMSVPFFFTPLTKGEEVLVDGGLTENLFFSYLLPKAGQYDLFILVDVSSRIKPIKKDASVFTLLNQCFSIMMSSEIKSSLKLLDADRSPNSKAFKSKMVYITPDIQDVGRVNFGKAEEAISRGYDAFSGSKRKIISLLARRK